MVTRTKQDWTIGNKVRVGWMTLTVQGVRAVRDGKPDIYTLVSDKGVTYDFTPHNGLVRVWGR